LEDGALVMVDNVDSKPVNYSVIPLPGEQIVESYLDGSSLRQFPFAFQTVKSTADDLERIETVGFLEDLMDWFEERTEEENLPTLEGGKESESIEISSWGYLYDQGVSDTGIYQIIGRLVYKQSPYTPATGSS
jgi:hypothetical protein